MLLVWARLGSRYQLDRAHAELDSHGVPRTWGPNKDYAPDVPARIARALYNRDNDTSDIEFRIFISMIDSLAEAYKGDRDSCGLDENRNRDRAEHLSWRVQSVVEWWGLGGREVVCDRKEDNNG